MALDESVANALLQRQLQKNQQLAAENAQLREQVIRLQADLAKASKRIEELERTKARQTAPFRRRNKQGNGKPGRKPGFRGTQRQRPPQIDQEIDVPLEIKTCPDCQCRLEQRPLTQIIEELPPIRPEVTRLTTWHATCPCCKKQWHSQHELQVSAAQGAAGIHLGPRATALATILKMHFGLTLRKTSSVLKQGFGLSISAGGLSHLLQRVAGKAKATYEELIEKIRSSPAVYADETSWYVGQPNYWLWVFTTPQYTLYHVDASRGRPVAEKILGKDFAGVLVTDCASLYKKIDCQQHKCIAHHLRRLVECRLREDTKSTEYLDAWEQFWNDVIGLAKARADLPSAEFDAQHAVLKTRMEALIEQNVKQVGDRKFQTRMRNARKHLLGCLEHDVEPTNNRAERAIRPAVIARKLSCGNKTKRGARTWKILASHSATVYQQGKDLLADFVQIAKLNPVLAG
jgi:hypothetical protein